MEQEIENFKKESKKINELKRRLKTDQDKLSQELAEIEMLKESEKKKIEEEKRRIRRDRILLEKEKKGHKGGVDFKNQLNVFF